MNEILINADALEKLLAHYKAQGPFEVGGSTERPFYVDKAERVLLLLDQLGFDVVPKEVKTE